MNPVTLSYDEAIHVCALLHDAAFAIDDGDLPRDTWSTEARLVIDLILGRTSAPGQQGEEDR